LSIQAKDKEFSPSTSFDHKAQLNTPNNWSKKVQIIDKGVGEYSIEQSLCLSQLPTLKSYGQPSTSMQSSSNPITLFEGKFIKESTQEEESEDKAIFNWLYKDEEESTSLSIAAIINIPMEQYGKGFSIL
jgi:hypothetical protein